MMIQLVLCNAKKFHQNVKRFLDLSSALAFRFCAALLEAKNETIFVVNRDKIRNTQKFEIIQDHNIRNTQKFEIM